MNEKEAVQPGPGIEAMRQRLIEVRDGLLRLHKALLESERVSYEQTFGKIQSPYQFLQLATNDSWFAWLRPVSQLIIVMDETLDAKEPLTATMVDALVTRAKTMLVASEGGEEFSRHYDEALQRDPNVIFAHAAVAKFFKAKAAGQF